jgi:hypothetical protein
LRASLSALEFRAGSANVAVSTTTVKRSAVPAATLVARLPTGAALSTSPGLSDGTEKNVFAANATVTSPALKLPDTK